MQKLTYEYAVWIRIMFVFANILLQYLKITTLIYRLEAEAEHAEAKVKSHMFLLLVDSKLFPFLSENTFYPNQQGNWHTSQLLMQGLLNFLIQLLLAL